MPAKNRAHYAGNYARRARAVRAAAFADPLTKCWRCGKTRAEHKTRWQAGHIVDHDPRSILAAECETCNQSAGGVAGANARWHKPPPIASRRW